MIFSFFSATFATIAAALLMLFAPIANFISPPTSQPLIIPAGEQTVAATSSPVSFPIAPTAPVKKTPPLVPPQNPAPIIPPPALITLPPATTTQNIVIGTTTLAVAGIPLLSGGTAHAGETIPVSYLQITNTGNGYALLKGFWLTQNGSALTAVVIGLSTIDDQGASRGLVGGQEGSAPFTNGTAFAPTSEVFAPGETRLFTIKAILSENVASYVGTQLKLDVTAIDSTASTTSGAFPIRGTTWTIAP